MNFREFLKDNIVYLDGGLGTQLQARGLKPGELPETWNVLHPEAVTEIHKNYYDAGSNLVVANSFGATTLKFGEEELEEIIRMAVSNVKAARDASTNKGPKFIGFDLGPLGKLLKPLGDLDFEEAVSIFAHTVRLAEKHGAEVFFIETMNDSYETKAALLAVKENSSLPVLVSNAYGEDGKLMTGASPSAMVALAEGMGADAIGANCSLGPGQLRGVMDELLEHASIPVLLKPNAGLPKLEDGKTVYDVTSDQFVDEIADMMKKGVRLVGGCCGTTPEYIEKVTERTKDIQPVAVTEKNITMVSSYTHAVKFEDKPVLIGERINPTGKKRFKQALIENDIDYILEEGVKQDEKGVEILDVNVGLPDIDEVKMMGDVVCQLQGVVDLPLQIDTSNIEAMEKGLRLYNGKAMINSVNGKKESMEAVFPLVKKYGGVVVALTLDEEGIPATAQGRIKIAQKILETAKEYGIDKKDIIFDTLAMTISADNKAALATLDALDTIKHEIGCHTSLGVSNISFGLPNRNAINAAFFAMALQKGLSAAIMNPNAADMMRTFYAFKALAGLDENCEDYIANIDKFVETAPVKAAPASGQGADLEASSGLQYAIIKGLKERASALTKELIKDKDPLVVVNEEVIPALNKVGEGFEKKQVYLPSLLMSAEAAKEAFEVVKVALSESKTGEMGDTFVIATVHGDIHDIGKNIVKLLLENYGFNVVDLGRDVPPEGIVEKVVDTHAPLVGLSALMTTTVPAMEETIRMLKEKAPWCKIVVGGAVLTEEFANKIGADKYAKDAMETVRYGESQGK